MIGSLLSAHYVGKKPWGVSAIFWAIVLVVGLVIGSVLGVGIVVSLLLGIAVFLGVAWYYLKIHPVWLGIIMYIVAFVIDIIIGMVIAGLNGGGGLF